MFNMTFVSFKEHYLFLLRKSLFLLLTAVSFASYSEEAVDCDNAISTLEINYCAGLELGRAEDEMNAYLQASFKHNSYDPELVKAMKDAQLAWQGYVDSHCDSVYIQWREGTIRGVMGLTCQTQLTKQRTHVIWENFLTYMDSTPPVLPEPSLE